jgi:CRP-like cAMP-binding protein
VSSGRCRIQGGGGLEFGVLQEGDVFSEHSFLFGGSEPCTVVSLNLNKGRSLLSRADSRKPVEEDAPARRSLARSIRTKSMRRLTISKTKQESEGADADGHDHARCTHLLKMTRSSLATLFETEPVVVIQFYRSVARQLAARMKALEEKTA